MLSAVDVLLLARFIAAAQQEHQGRVPDRVIDAIALGHVDPQLADSLAHAPVVAEIAFLNTGQCEQQSAPAPVGPAVLSSSGGRSRSW